MRSLFSALCLLLCLSCHQQETAKPVFIDPPIPGVLVADAGLPQERTDIPDGGLEVKGSGWSFVLPAGFIARVDGTNWANPAVGMLISFATYPGQKDDLATFALTNLLRTNTILGVHTGHFAGNAVLKDNVLVVQSLYGADAGIETMDSSLDFFVARDTTTYRLTCLARASHIVEQAPICMAIARSLLLN